MSTIFKPLLTVLLIGLLLFGGMTLLAQDSTEIPPDTPVQFIPDDGSAGAGLANDLANVLRVVFYIPSATGLVLVLTSFVKRFVPLSANLIALGFMGVIWLVYIVVNQLGFGSQFEPTLKAITDIGNIMLGLTATPIVTTWFYNQAKAAKVPIVGFSKTP